MNIKTVYVYPPGSGPGCHGLHWMAFYEGQETEGPRGWGDTAREAEDSLRRNPLERRPPGIMGAP